MNSEQTKEAARLRKQSQRKRDKEDVTNPEMSHNLPDMSHSDVTQIKPKGTDKITAAKLLIICQSLNKFDVAQGVRFGVNGPTMDIVSDRLGAS